MPIRPFFTAWYGGAFNCRSAGRFRDSPDLRDNHLSFCVALKAVP
jgi:hypothetical protein